MRIASNIYDQRTKCLPLMALKLTLSTDLVLQIGWVQFFLYERYPILSHFLALKTPTEDSRWRFWSKCHFLYSPCTSIFGGSSASWELSRETKWHAKWLPNYMTKSWKIACHLKKSYFMGFWWIFSASALQDFGKMSQNNGQM